MSSSSIIPDPPARSLCSYLFTPKHFDISFMLCIILPMLTKLANPPYSSRLISYRSIFMDIFKYILLITALIWLTAWGAEGLGYNWQWYQIPKYIFTYDNNGFSSGPLLKGLGVTLEITVISLFLSFAIGLIAAFFRLSGSFSARLLSRLYLEIIRNTPLLVQLFFIYFVISPVLDMNRMTAAVLALSLFEGAYASEIFRAGILSIHKGQWEAAYSLGLSKSDTYRKIILPQAIRRILPPLTSQGISLIKDSALVSTIAIYDLTMQGQVIISETYLTFEVWFTIAAIYLAITMILSITINRMEKRIRLE